jgi:hypothetical protein
MQQQDEHEKLRTGDPDGQSRYREVILEPIGWRQAVTLADVSGNEGNAQPKSGEHKQRCDQHCARVRKRR